MSSLPILPGMPQAGPAKAAGGPFELDIRFVGDEQGLGTRMAGNTIMCGGPTASPCTYTICGGGATCNTCADTCCPTHADSRLC